jgi:alpha-beta hydrolase superfamily lysophospholipase
MIKKGIALRLDDRGIGGSSKGTKRYLSKFLLLISKLQQLLANKGYLNIGLLGHSEGGMIAPMLRKAKHTIYSFNGSTRDSG